MTRRRYELTDKQWLIIEPLLAIRACEAEALLRIFARRPRPERSGPTFPTAPTVSNASACRYGSTEAARAADAAAGRCWGQLERIPQPSLLCQLRV